MFTSINTDKNENMSQKHFSNQEQVILNICYNPETGKLTLSDNYNNHYSCDLFGRIKKRFFPNVTGQASFKERKIKTEEKYKMPKTTNNFYINNKGLIEYYPQTRKFDGYFNFPRPLSPPFCNLPNYAMKEATKKELINHLEKYFSEPKSKQFVSNKNLNIEVSYLTGDLNEFDCLKVDNEKLLKLIKNTLDSIREEYALKMNIFNKVPMVKALYQFRKYIKENKESVVINNRRLRKPNSTIKKKYDIIHSTITNFGLKRDNFKKSHKLKLDTIMNDNTSKPLKKQLLTLESLKDKSIEKNLMLKKIFKNDFKIGRKINMNFGYSLYEEQSKKLQAQEKNDKNKNNLIEPNKETEATKETEQSLYVKTLDNKIRNNNLSFISKMFDEGKNNKRNLMKNIKQMKFLKNNYIKEKQLLKGFEAEERKKPMLLIKNLKPKLKTNGELFDEDMDLLRRTNPIAFQVQQKKDEFDMKQLIKKVNMLKVNEQNIMKGKNLTITKKENTIE